MIYRLLHPYYPDGNSSDITTIYTQEKIGNTVATQLAIADPDYYNVTKWRDLYEKELDPYLYVELNGVYHIVYFSFSRR